MEQEASVLALAERYTMTLGAVQKHVAVLERVGLVVKHVVRGDASDYPGCSSGTGRSATGRLGRLEDLMTTIGEGAPCPS